MKFLLGYADDLTRESFGRGWYRDLLRMLCNYRTCLLGPVRELVNANWGNVPHQCSIRLIKECGPPNHIWRMLQPVSASAACDSG